MVCFKIFHPVLFYSVPKAKMLYWVMVGRSTPYLWDYNLFIQIRIYQDKWESNLRWINHLDYWNLSYSIKSLDDLQFYSCLKTQNLSTWIDIYFCGIPKRIPIISQLPEIKVCLRLESLSDLLPIFLCIFNTVVGYLFRILTLH